MSDSSLQKQSPLPPMPLQVKNSEPPNSEGMLPSKAMVTGPSFHYTATQGNRRYDCRFTSQLPPLQSAQQTTKHSPADTPQARDTQAPSARNGLYRSSHQPWADRSEKDSLTGNVTVPFCDVTGCPSILSQPFIEPRRPSVMTGAPTLAPSNSEKGLGPCSQPSNSVIDTHATKESLVRDMKKLVEIKKKFSELARKIKINKDLLISAGCIKTSTSYKELTQHSALALKDTARLQPGPQVPAQILPGPPLPTQIQSRILAQIQPQILAQIPPGPQVTVVPTEKPPILLASEEAAKSSSVQEAKHRKPEPVGYISADTTCMAPAQLHGKHILTPARPSVVDIAQAAVGDAAQFPPGNPASLQQSTPGNPPLAAAPHLEQPQPLKDHTSKTSSTYKSSLLHYLLHDSSPKRGADDPVSGTQSLEPQPSTHTAGGQPDSRAEETPGTTGTPVPGSPLLAGQASSASSLAAPQGGNPCSLELLATCLSLWKKPPSEPATSGVASVEGQPVATCTRNSLLPSAEGHPEGRVPATPQNAVLVVQNHEPGGAILTKGTELQIAVVTPIILSEAKVPVPAPALEPIFPVIKEGSVCSLQDPLTKSVSTSLTACVSATSPLVSTKASPLAHKGKPDHCSNRSSEDTRPTHASHGGGLDSEPQEPSAPSSSGSSENILQIDSICSLVEGDTSYNSQIAKMFSVPPLQKAEPQTPPCSTLTEQASGHTGKRDSGPQEDGCVQGPAQPHIPAAPVAPLGPPRAEPPKQEGTDSGAAEGCMRSASEDGATGPRCSPIPQGTAVPTTSTAQDALGAGALEEEKEEVEESPDSGLDDQLLELLKEFPYGLEPACRPLPQPMPEQTPTGSATPKDASDQIQITVLSSKQMKELFPEQDEPAKPPEQGPAMEQEPATTEGHGDCPLAAATSAESPDCVIMDMEKDISCCALGWLGKIYEGVPPCHCQPAKKRKREERHPSGPGGNSEKQKEKTSRKSGHATSSQDLPCLHTKASPTAHDRKKTEEGKTGGDKAHAKHGGNCSSSSTPRTEADPRNSRKPGALHSHRSSTKWTIEQFSFHATSSTAKITQEKLQKKPCLQGTSPFKAKVSFLSSKSKDLHRKPGSLVSALTSPEKRKLKLKAGGSLQGLWGKRKREEGNGSGLASSFNKKREEHRGIVETDAPKLCLSSSSPCEPTAKEKPASLDTRPSMAAEGSSKGSRASSLEYLQRQKHKDGLRASKKNYRKISSRDSQFLRAGKLGMRPGLSKKHGGPGQSSGEPLGLNILGKSFRAYHKEPKPLSSHERGAAEPRPAEKMRADRPRGDKLASQEDTSLPAPGQAKDQRKLYLNRVGFRCTERESICLSKLEGSPQKPSRDKQQAHMEPGSPFAGREGLEKCSMLEFKLCPETLIKSVGSAEERREKACPRRERPPVQGAVRGWRPQFQG
ncbi:retroelement silencing factor 1 [Erinaceus europaeus]|uniref:Retroelement silencing factor 1 n=1 Tax=Erinaceus europaeus TaxID=9365 RepID=A0ABM3XP66_ERIEU|nr:retroelement silencing factor 1 [Erinaceus europaeus]